MAEKQKIIDSDTKAAVVDRENIITQFLKKVSFLQGMKKINREDIEAKEDLNVSKQDEANTEPEVNEPAEPEPAPVQAQKDPETFLGKRQMIADSDLFDEHGKVRCQLLARRGILNPNAESLKSASGVLMREDMYEFLCKCDDCLDLYLQVDPGLGLLTDTYIEDENFKEALEETNKEPLEEVTVENADSEFMSYMAGKFKERLGRDITQFETMVMSEKYGKLKDRLGTLIMQSGKTEITEKDMRDFLSVLYSEASGMDKAEPGFANYQD